MVGYSTVIFYLSSSILAAEDNGNIAGLADLGSICKSYSRRINVKCKKSLKCGDPKWDGLADADKKCVRIESDGSVTTELKGEAAGEVTAEPDHAEEGEEGLADLGSICKSYSRRINVKCKKSLKCGDPKWDGLADDDKKCVRIESDGSVTTESKDSKKKGKFKGSALYDKGGASKTGLSAIAAFAMLFLF